MTEMRLTDVRDRLCEACASQHASVTDGKATALTAEGVFVARVPNAVSPLGGHISDGDFTHQTSFTVPSIRQLTAAAGFGAIVARPCPPVAHGLASAARVVVWHAVSACYRLALDAETGQLRDQIVTQNLTFAARKDAPPAGTGKSDNCLANRQKR